MEERIKNFIPHEVNYAFEDTISYSSYSTYQTCNHKWYLKYVKDLDPNPPTIFTTFGTAIHETIQNYLDILYNKSEIEANAIDIEEYFCDRFRENYQLDYKENKNEHFSSPEEMNEFFGDGKEILKWFKTHRDKYFSTNKIKLLGVELPLMVKMNKFIYFKGYIDFVLYNEIDDTITIFDIKTSTRGWNKEKKDEVKLSQLLLYKEFFAKQYDVDVDKIEVEYFIVKRKIYDKSEFVIPRVQSFSPANGKNKRKKVMEGLGDFVNSCYDEQGNMIEKEYKKNPSKDNCKYCFFNNKPTLCDKNK